MICLIVSIRRCLLKVTRRRFNFGFNDRSLHARFSLFADVFDLSLKVCYVRHLIVIGDSAFIWINLFSVARH